MESEKLINIVVDALEEIKAHHIDVIDVSKITSLFGSIIIASADSTRQTKSLADNVQEKVKAAGGKIYGTEGEQSGEWMLVDLGDAVVHIMLPAVREHYNLEGLWSRRKH
ncbi:MAG: ribosome silencing factor [Nitrosomonas sp.]|nr:MAG: ribosome silencing factor [Nitrosomonas sp.]